MIQLEENQQNQAIKCKIHKGYPLYYFNTNLSSDSSQTAFCPRCITTKRLQGEDLLFYADISELKEQEVLSNWPIVDDKSILLKLQKIINGKNEEQEDNYQIIENFIDSLLYRINQKMIKMKKAVMNSLEDNIGSYRKLIETYNRISLKNSFQQSIQLINDGNIQGLQEIENIIQKSYENRKQNQEILEEQINKFEESQKFLQLKFPKLIEKQLFKNIKLIKHFLLNKDGKKDKKQVVENQNKILDEFKDYLTQCTSTFVQEYPNFKELKFTNLQNPQFEFILQTIQYQIQKNQQVNLLDKEKLREHNYDIFQSIEKLSKEYQSQAEQFNKKQQSTLNELMLLHEYEFDVIEKYQFIKSLKDNCSQTNQIIKKSKLGLTKIKQISQQLMVQFFTEKAIDPAKKYTIQFEFKPFIGEEESYKIAIGVIQKSKCNYQWLDQDNAANSDLFFSNHNSNKFNLCKKGKLINNNEIRRSEQMRKLEVQFCLKDKFFQIADFPGKNNISQAKEEEMVRYQPNQEYVFGIEHYSIKSIKVLKFIEGFPKI